MATPADRIKAMTTRSLSASALDFELADLVKQDPAKLKKKLAGKANLIVVRSLELDSAGEKGFHLGTFEHTLRMVRDAVFLLAQAGVERFVLTADHGFLLQDRTTENLDFGANKLQAKRRHALSTLPSGRSDALDIKLSALEYDVSEERYLALCRHTALWKTAEKVAPFVHGGNSLQERVIPVLMLERHGRRGKVTASYEVVATPLPAELGRQRLQVQVRLQRENSATLNFHGPKRITLALRVFDRPDVVTRIVSVSPPGSFDGSGIAIPPGAEAATIDFELEGETDERVRVEIFHPEGVESVKPSVVEGFFQSFRNRRAEAKPSGDAAKTPAAVPPSALPTKAEPDWAELVADERYRRVLAILEAGTMVNEADLRDYLGNARQVRLFALRYEQVTEHLPFAIEIRTVGGLKTYVRKD